MGNCCTKKALNIDDLMDMPTELAKSAIDNTVKVTSKVATDTVDAGVSVTNKATTTLKDAKKLRLEDINVEDKLPKPKLILETINENVTKKVSAKVNEVKDTVKETAEEVQKRVAVNVEATKKSLENKIQKKTVEVNRIKGKLARHPGSPKTHRILDERLAMSQKHLDKFNKALDNLTLDPSA